MTTHGHHFAKRGHEFSVSKNYTTRQPRSENDKEYFFVSKEKFETLIEEKFFFEHENVFGNYYGIPYSTAEQNNVFFIIDVYGMEKLKKMFPNSIAIMVIPPNYTTLQERLKERMDWQERIKRATLELKMAHKFDFVIVNDDLNEAVNILHNIVSAKMHTKDSMSIIENEFYDS
jgi:guanylate kinase